MGANESGQLGYPDFVKGISALPRTHIHWSACSINGRVNIEQVDKWPMLSIESFKQFKKFTGLRFMPNTVLHRDPGKPHIFAVNPSSNLAVCVYRHTREF